MKIVSLFCFLLFAFSLTAQIESGKTGPKKKKKNPEKEKTEVIKAPETLTGDYTLLKFSYSYGSSYRSLKPNGDFYGEPLGERSKETRLPVSGFHLGVNTKFEGHIHLDFGIGFQQFGEQYNNGGSDTIIEYTSTYSRMVLPLKVQYHGGKKTVFFVGAGFEAQLLAAYSNKTTTTIESKESSVKVTTLKNKAPFSLAAVASAGVQLPLGKKLTFLASGEYSIQLSNTFNKQATYVHRSDLFGVKLGLGYKL